MANAGTCTRHERFSAKCPNCQDAMNAIHIDQLEQKNATLLAALKDAANSLHAVGAHVPYGKAQAVIDKLA